MMSGKIVVVVVLLIGAAVFAYGLYFTAETSPADMRFDQRRDALPTDAAITQVFPVRLGDFLLDTSVQPARVTGADGITRLKASYLEIGRNVVQIEAEQITPATGILALEDRMAAFRRDQTVGRLTSHFEAQTPFFYVTYATDGLPTYAFYWVNGTWLLRAYSVNTDEEAVLRFANVYPY